MQGALPMSISIPLEALNPETIIPGLRDFYGDPMTAGTLLEYRRNDYRVYDIECPYILSHTRHFCGYENCPEG